ncbi:hypothetical protein [Herbaspirillum sp. NPDC087042]|uniref:hypothetical protein n=1 Tax=Herbaspirillum sp. NPDC087042 TaxID=3364004 RepID=UPI0038193EF3
MSVASMSGNGDFAARTLAYASIHRSVPTNGFIANLDTDVAVLTHGQAVIPCTINHGPPGDAWVCSPSVTYGAYLAEEVDRSLPRLLARPARMLCAWPLRMLERAGLDRCVTLNNWMLATNLFPSLDPAALDEWIAQARQRWPTHAIWLRSLNMCHNREWIAHLVARGFRLLPSRQVYLFDAPGRGAHANMQRDFRLLRTTPLSAVTSEDFLDADYQRIETLYAMLYMDKYSRFNPRYRESFFRNWHRKGLLEFSGFRDADGVLQAVVGMFAQDGVVTAPVVGYNTALPVSLGLYRLLMARVLELAMQRGWNINFSAGAALFKRLRGGRAEIEYSAVLDSHLGLRHRSTLSAVRYLASHVGVPLMKRYQL